MNVKKIIYNYACSPTDYTIYKLLSNFVLKKVPLEASICDVGCGSGKYSKFLCDLGYSKITSIDPSPHIKLNYEKINFVNQSLEEFAKHHKKQFDLVICIDVIEHIKEDKFFFNELTTLLKKQGWLILVTPAHPKLYSSRDILYGHYRRYSKHQIKGYFKEKYTNLEIKTIGWSIFLKMATWLEPFRKKKLENISLKNQTIQSFEFKPPPLYWKMNKILKFFYNIFYLGDLLFADSDKGCEFFIIARKK